MLPDFTLFKMKGYKGHLAALKKVFNREDVDEIINACDAGREGECIFRYIYNYLGCTKPVKRLWINSLTDEAIMAGISVLKDSSEYDGLFAAGYARAKADWIYGMNLSRLYGLKYNANHHVGRVKTPLLSIISERDEQIEAFEKKTYFKLVLDNGAECSRNFDSMEEAEKIKLACEGKTAIVSFVSSEEKKENRPLLYDLSLLQRDANDIYGMTAAAALKTAQSLYEKKLITYSRTDSNYISEDMMILAESIVKCLASYDKGRTDKLLKQGLNLDKRVVNNEKINDHHAIIPTNLIGRLSASELNDRESKIIKLVINRFLSALDKPYTYLEKKYEFDIGGEKFRLTQKTPIEFGWREYTSRNDKTKPTVSYFKNQLVDIGNAEIRECQTKPPAHFTESSLIAVMESIDRRIEDKELKPYVKERGLGTPATRADIIESLISAKYIQRRKRFLIATEFGRKFVSTLPEIIRSPELTAHMEQELTDIEQGRFTEEDFMSEIIENISEVISNDTSEITENNEAEMAAPIGKCPWCGSDVKEGKKAFYCSNGEDCDFFIYKHDKRIGRDYKPDEISELLEKGRVTLRGCISTKGNKYAAVFELDDSGEYVNLKFVDYVKSGGKRNKKE